MATIYEVSKAAGVSLATVSRVMNGNSKVSERTRNKVLKAMDELGYRPNAIAQSLASNRTNSVGLLVSELHGSFFGDLMSTVEKELRADGKHVIITAGHSDEAREKEAIEFLKSRRCDALILHAEAVCDDYLRELNESGVSLVLVNRMVPGMEQQCFVLDNEAGGYLATKAAIDAGHRDIGYISGPQSKEDARQRLAGHVRALREAGLNPEDALIYQGDYHESEGANGFKQLWQQHPGFSALMCANDEMASGAMTAAREEGISIPEQLSVVGFDDVLFARYLHPRLTTVDNPVSAMGLMAARWVLLNVYKKKLSGVIKNVFLPELISRDSLGTHL